MVNGNMHSRKVFRVRSVAWGSFEERRRDETPPRIGCAICDSAGCRFMISIASLLGEEQAGW
jgi:hypothetical protein